MSEELEEYTEVMDELCLRLREVMMECKWVVVVGGRNIGRENITKAIEDAYNKDE